MEKIDSLGETFPRKSRKKSKTKSKQPLKYRRIFERVEAGNESSFLTGDEGYNGPHYEKLEELLEEIYGLGDRLKGIPTMENIKNYKNAVKEFLKVVSQKMVGVESRTSGTHVLKRKHFTLLKIIDTKLEQLTLHFLKDQESQLDILSRVDEINGLLINILK
jgi:uncharacterized protein